MTHLQAGMVGDVGSLKYVLHVLSNYARKGTFERAFHWTRIIFNHARKPIWWLSISQPFTFQSIVLSAISRLFIQNDTNLNRVSQAKWLFHLVKITVTVHYSDELSFELFFGKTKCVAVNTYPNCKYRVQTRSRCVYFSFSKLISHIIVWASLFTLTWSCSEIKRFYAPYSRSNPTHLITCGLWMQYTTEPVSYMRTCWQRSC